MTKRTNRPHYIIHSLVTLRIRPAEINALLLSLHSGKYDLCLHFQRSIFDVRKRKEVVFFFAGSLVGGIPRCEYYVSRVISRFQKFTIIDRYESLNIASMDFRFLFLFPRVSRNVQRPLCCENSGHDIYFASKEIFKHLKLHSSFSFRIKELIRHKQGRSVLFFL